MFGCCGVRQPERLNARTPDRLIQFEAIRLFVERAAFGPRGFVLTEESNAAAMAFYASLGAERPHADDVMWDLTF